VIADLLRKMWKWLVFAITVAFIVFIGLLYAASWMFNQTQQARMTLHEYGDALIAKEYSKAYSLRDSELQKALNESEFEKSHELAASQFGKLKEVILERGEKVGDQNGMTVTINSRLIYENTEHHFAVMMKKEGDRWFVHNYRYIEK
jgi:hypothetical protein